ncbi:MAG: hypothetical protein OEZ68_21770 [Gammaproteobacteria bacterium]|nr:hypothetical protein [Gammaproteobacteria bacterium]MDH5803427.1 hypothetical protein [Gammaproteobacteria bacterium]
MKALVSYIMRGRLEAIAAVAGFTVLSLVISPFMYLSVPAVALVALRHGLKEVLPPLATAVIILTMASLSPYAIALAFVVLLALIVRLTRSLALTLVVASGILCLTVAVVHVAVGDVGAWWLSMVKEMDTAALRQEDLPNREQLYANLELMAPQIVGIFAAAFLMHSLLCLFIARAWQAMLYNPGGFRQEFYSLNLGKVFAVVVAALIGLAMWDLGLISIIAKDAIMMAAILYLLQGVSVLHVLFHVKKLPPGVLYGMYGFIALSVIMAPVFQGLLQYVLVFTLLLMVQGYVETWANLRGRMQAQFPNDPQ